MVDTFRIQSSDATIWNKDQLIEHLMYSITNNSEEIHLDSLAEGPCAQSLGLYSILDNFCKTYKYPKKNISYTTCNLKEKHNEYCITVQPQMQYIDECRKLLSNVNTTKKFNKNFKTIGHFIGHGNLHRLHIASYLYNHASSVLQTYHTKLGESYHSPFIGIDELLDKQYPWQVVEDALMLLKNSPITLDKIEKYPILIPTTFNISKAYTDFFVEVVSCTYFTGNTFYIDEKIWRPIAMRTPFIVQGPQYFLNNLRKLGFRTFEKYWDEGYSEDPAEYQSFAINDILQFLSQKSPDEIKQIYQDMQSTLDHNLKVLHSLKMEDFLQVYE